MQQGQVFELKRRAVDGSLVWAYRYRTGGPGSRRLQRGGFPSERDAGEAPSAITFVLQIGASKRVARARA